MEPDAIVLRIPIPATVARRLQEAADGLDQPSLEAYCALLLTNLATIAPRPPQRSLDIE